MKRVIMLGMFWIPYWGVFIFTDLFVVGSYIILMEDFIRWGLSLLGYGLIGSGFYALTGQNRTDRFLEATFINVLFNVSFFFLSLFVLYSDSRIWI